MATENEVSNYMYQKNEKGLILEHKFFPSRFLNNNNVNFGGFQFDFEFIFKLRTIENCCRFFFRFFFWTQDD